MLVQSAISASSAKVASIANMSELYRGPKPGQDESKFRKSLPTIHLRRILFLEQILTPLRQLVAFDVESPCANC
jgi:hypothetical protein